jgi:PAS domain S-box-containing protein
MHTIDPGGIPAPLHPNTGLLPRLKANALPIVASLVYLVLGWLWITLSDNVGELLFTSPEQLTRYQTYKGAGFVVATAALMYWMLSRARGRQSPAAASLVAGRHWPLRVMLSLLAMATALPLVGLMGFALYRESEHEIDKANQLVKGLADVSAAEALAFMNEHVRVADMLAYRNLVRELDPARCDPVLLDVLAVRPALADIQTTDATGRTICSVRQATGRAPLQHEVSRLEAAGADLVVGPPQREPDTGRWVVSLSHPMAGQPGARGSVQLFVYLSALHPFVGGALPAGGVAGLYDYDGHAIARSVAPAAHVGYKFQNKDLLAYVRSERSGEGIAVGPDQVERLYAFRPVTGTPWFVVAGVPTLSIYTPARSKALLYGLAALCILGISAWLVMRISRGISEPMAALTRTAQRVGAGQFDERAPEGGPLEVAQVAQGFNHMLERIPLIERGLLESEERHRSLVELAPDGIVVQHNGVVTFANEGFLRMMDIDGGTPLAALSLVDMALPEYRVAIRDRLAQLQASPSVANPMDLTLQRADGTLVEVEQACCSLYQDDRIVVQTHFRDVTARNQARRDLEQANQTLEARIAERTAELRAANKALGDFTSTVAHDLRAPAARMSGFASALTDAIAASNMERAVHHASRITHNALLMDNIIDGLLQMSRAGTNGLAWRQVDMQQLVTTVLADLECPPGLVSVGALPVVPADPATIRQVWTNLISNAVKYSARHPEALVRLDCRAAARDFVFSVRDNGIGFDPADAAQLFGVFKRLPGAEDFEGVGVGLAVVRRIVERHGGQVWAEARPGEGSTFYFSLPRSRSHDA